MSETRPASADVIVPGGRTVCVYEAGDPDGRAVVVHHGSPACGLVDERDAELARERGLRLIGFDRAGYGGSDRRPGRLVADVVPDVVAILDALGVERFATWGTSGGGPHALACAALLGHRCDVAISVSGVAPYDAAGLDWLEGMGEENVAEFVAAIAGEDALVAWLGDTPRRLCEAQQRDIVAAWRTVLSPVDARMLGEQTGARSVRVLRRALAGGAGGWIDDDLAFLQDWGFALADIDVPVEIWHGRHDLMVPPAHGEWLARAMPAARLAFLKDDGHVSLLERRMPEIFDAIARYTF